MCVGKKTILLNEYLALHIRGYLHVPMVSESP